MEKDPSNQFIRLYSVNGCWKQILWGLIKKMKKDSRRKKPRQHGIPRLINRGQEDKSAEGERATQQRARAMGPANRGQEQWGQSTEGEWEI